MTFIIEAASVLLVVMGGSFILVVFGWFLTLVFDALAKVVK